MENEITPIYDLFLGLWTQIFGSGMETESIQIICRYLSVFCSIGLYCLVIYGLLKICKIIIDL